jgi:hypothetical protein
MYNEETRSNITQEEVDRIFLSINIDIATDSGGSNLAAAFLEQQTETSSTISHCEWTETGLAEELRSYGITTLYTIQAPTQYIGLSESLQLVRVTISRGQHIPNLYFVLETIWEEANR